MKKEKGTNQIKHTFEQTAHSFDSKHQKTPKNTDSSAKLSEK